MYKAGFIGTGVMGSAIARAVRKSVPGSDLLLSNIPAIQAQELAKELDCAHGVNVDVAGQCRYIYLAVKPQVIASVLKEISPVLKARKDPYTLVSIAAGVSVDTIRSLLDIPGAGVIRVMPNTAALVGEAVLLCAFANVSDEEKAEFFRLTQNAGLCDEVPEKLIDSAGALTGCGPAFAFMVMQALADGAVACGVDRIRARKYAAMTLLGSAKLALESGKHFEQLKDEVCSPAGSTIEGVRVLEDAGIRSAFTEAVCASFEKNRELGKQK